MPIVGFNFDKISAERKGKITVNDKIAYNLSITSVDKEKLDFGAEEDVLKFSFEFKVEYGGAGEILLCGFLLYMGQNKEIKSILDMWKKDKKLPDKLTGDLFNTILFRCNVDALNLARNVGLPPHIRFPRIQIKKEEATQGQ